MKLHSRILQVQPDRVGIQQVLKPENFLVFLSHMQFQVQFKCFKGTEVKGSKLNSFFSEDLIAVSVFSFLFVCLC